jgi:hypothetical protein
MLWRTTIIDHHARIIMPGRAPPVLLDTAHAEFMQQGVSIVAASRDTEHTPMLARATGCKVGADLRRVTLYVWAPRADGLLACVRATGTLAVVFSEIPSHRTIQVKATNARITKITRLDHGRIERYRDAFDQALGTLDCGGTFARGLVSGDLTEYVGITFTPAALFGQTPGPGAGAPLVLGR